MSAGAADDRRTERGWWIDAGDYTLHVGRSSAELAKSCRVTAEAEIGPLVS